VRIGVLMSLWPYKTNCVVLIFKMRKRDAGWDVASFPSSVQIQSGFSFRAFSGTRHRYCFWDLRATYKVLSVYWDSTSRTWVLIHVRGWISRWVTVLIYLPCISLTSPRGRSMSVDVPTDSTAVWWEWECGVLCEVDEGTRRESPYCVLLSFIVRLFEFFVFFFFVNVLAFCVVVCRFIAFYSFFFRLVFGFVGARTLTLYVERSSSPS